MIPEAPQPYKHAGIALLVGGLINALLAVTWASALLCVCIGVLWIVPFALAVLEAATGYSMMEGNPRGNAKLTAVLGLCISALLMNPFSLAAEIIALVWLSDVKVEAWLAGEE